MLYLNFVYCSFFICLLFCQLHIVYFFHPEFKTSPCLAAIFAPPFPHSLALSQGGISILVYLSIGYCQLFLSLFLFLFANGYCLLHSFLKLSTGFLFIPLIDCSPTIVNIVKNDIVIVMIGSVNEKFVLKTKY